MRRSDSLSIRDSDTLNITSHVARYACRRLKAELHNSVSSPPRKPVTRLLISASRSASYTNVAHEPTRSDSLIHSLLWLSVLSFLGSPQGIFCLYGILHICSGFNNISNIYGQGPFCTFVQSSLITACGSIGTFVPFARMWDKFYQDNPQLHCQQDKPPRKLEVRRRESQIMSQ